MDNFLKSFDTWSSRLTKAREENLAFKLYTSSDCTLCDEARGILRDLASECVGTIEEVDISSIKGLWKKYRYEVPMLFVNGRLALSHFNLMVLLRRYRADRITREYPKRIRSQGFQRFTFQREGGLRVSREAKKMEKTISSELGVGTEKSSATASTKVDPIYHWPHPVCMSCGRSSTLKSARSWAQFDKETRIGICPDCQESWLELDAGGEGGE